MTRTRTHGPTSLRPPLRARRLPALLAFVLALLLAAPLGTAVAQSLPELLPEDVVAAVGVRDLEAERERIQPFLDEAERLGLAESVGDAVPGEEATEGDGEMPQIPEALADLGVMDLLGREAWIAVSASPFRAIPAVTAILRPSADAAEGFGTVIADAEGDEGIERLEEDGRTFWTYVPPGDESDVPVPIAYALADEGVLVVSTDPEIVRFVLRRLSGSDEASFADGDTYATLSSLGEGTTFGVLDAAPLVRSLEPFAAGFEAGPVVERIHDALVTAGPSVGLMRATDEGIESRSLLLPRQDGPDSALYSLLTEGSAAGTEVLRFAPDDAVMVTSSTFDVRGWWAWLDDVLASAESLGIPSASEMVGMFGVDPQTALLDWAGSRVVQIGTAPSVVAEAGIPQEGFGTDAALLLEVRDEEAARQGLQSLLSVLGPSAAAFTSPSGTEMAMPETVQVAGQDVQRLRLSDSLVLDAAVVDGWAVLSASPDVTEAVLTAQAEGSSPEALADEAAQVPASVRAWSVSDDRNAVLSSADALVAQLQLMAGMGGAGDLDFDAVDEASADLGAWMEFLGERLGTSRSVTTVEDGRVRTEGFSRVDW